MTKRASKANPNVIPDKVVVSAYLGPNEQGKELDIRDPHMEERVSFMIEALAFGFRPRACVKKFMDQFQLSETQAYRYLRTAEWEMQEYINQDRRKLLAKSVATMDALIRRATTKGDIRSAVMASHHKDNVLGLLGKFNDTGDTPNGVTGSGIDSIDEQSARALGEIIARAKITARIPESTPVEPQ